MRAFVEGVTQGAHGRTKHMGICEGRVAIAPRGTAGFGYDPIFVPEGAQRTIAEIPPEVKNRISHRARALRAAEPYLREILGLGEQDQRGRDAN